MRAPFLLAFGSALGLLAAACVSPPDGEDYVRTSLEQRTGVVPAPPAEPPAPSEEELVALALASNAAFRAALADLGVAEADWLEAGNLPPLSLSLLFPLGEKQIEYAAKLPVDALWLRPKRVAAAKLDWEATAEALVQHGLDLVRDVRSACAELAAARDRLGAAQATALSELRLAELAERRFRAGATSALAASAAHTRAFAGADRERTAQADLRVAEARLSELALPNRTEPATPLCPRPPLAAPAALPEVGGLVSDALAARPDLRAAEHALEAAGERAGLARREIFQLVAVFDANGSGSAFEAGPGIELPLLLDGGRAKRAGARARVQRASASYQAAVQRIAREVREAHARAVAAALSVRAWRDERLPELERLERRAAAGVTNGASDLSSLLEASIAFDQGDADAADALAAWRRARAELERAVGHRLDLEPVPAPNPTSVTP